MPTTDVRAVYSPKPPIAGKKLLEAASQHGLSLRLLLIGGGIPIDPAKLLKSLKLANGGALLVTGSEPQESSVLETLDQYIQANDRKSLTGMLNAYTLPWVELYSADFQYDKHLKIFARDQKNLNRAVPMAQQPLLRSARSRYIIHNESGNKECRGLMIALTQVLAEATDGIIADHRTPER